MTVQEAKESIEYLKMQLEEDLEMICFTGDELKAIDIAIECMEELEQYRELGTVEELKEAREKQIPATPCIEGDGYCPEGNLVYDTWICPNCEKDYEVDYDNYDYCPNCGQHIDRSDLE